MFNIIKTAIANGGYKLADIRDKIQRMYVRGMLTEANMQELLDMASNNVSAEAERPDVLEMLRSLSERVEALENRKDSPDEYEAWMPWNGISDKYQYGAIVRDEGKLWISTFRGQNVWRPGTPGTESFWAEYHAE